MALDESTLLEIRTKIHSWHKELVESGVVKFVPRYGCLDVEVHGMWVASLPKYRTVDKHILVDSIFNTVTAMQLKEVRNECNK